MIWKGSVVVEGIQTQQQNGKREEEGTWENRFILLAPAVLLAVCHLLHVGTAL